MSGADTEHRVLLGGSVGWCRTRIPHDPLLILEAALTRKIRYPGFTNDARLKLSACRVD